MAKHQQGTGCHPVTLAAARSSAPAEHNGPSGVSRRRPQIMLFGTGAPAPCPEPIKGTRAPSSGPRVCDKEHPQTSEMTASPSSQRAALREQQHFFPQAGEILVTSPAGGMLHTSTAARYTGTVFGFSCSPSQKEGAGPWPWPGCPSLPRKAELLLPFCTECPQQGSGAGTHGSPRPPAPAPSHAAERPGSRGVKAAASLHSPPSIHPANLTAPSLQRAQIDFLTGSNEQLHMKNEALRRQ